MTTDVSDAYLAEAYLALFDVSHHLINDSGPLVDPGTPAFVLVFLDSSPSSTDFFIIDVDGDGMLEVGEDYYSLSSLTYTGYVLENPTEELHFPIFSDGVAYFSAMTEEGLETWGQLQQADSLGYFGDIMVADLCFAAGTAIATPDGERAVETLSVGDLVCTSDGAAVPVRWIGRQAVARHFADPDRHRLIEIAPGAIAPGVPRRALRVTPDHAVEVAGILVNAGALVGLEGITLLPTRDLPERYTIYNVETEAHDLILAEGVAAETYVDYAHRARFDNYAEYVALYGEGTNAVREMDRPRWSARGSLPASVVAALAAPLSPARARDRQRMGAGRPSFARNPLGPRLTPPLRLARGVRRPEWRNW